MGFKMALEIGPLWFSASESLFCSSMQQKRIIVSEILVSSSSIAPLCASCKIACETHKYPTSFKVTNNPDQLMALRRDDITVVSDSLN